jgi:hypothetical protein
MMGGRGSPRRKLCLDVWQWTVAGQCLVWREGNKWIVGGWHPTGMGGVMRRRQLGVVGGGRVEDVMQTRKIAPELGCLVRGSHGSMQGELAHHTLVCILLVSTNCLGMLAQIVETREPPSTMTTERMFSSALPYDDE